MTCETVSGTLQCSHFPSVCFPTNASPLASPQKPSLSLVNWTILAIQTLLVGGTDAQIWNSFCLLLSLSHSCCHWQWSLLFTRLDIHLCPVKASLFCMAATSLPSILGAHTNLMLLSLLSSGSPPYESPLHLLDWPLSVLLGTIRTDKESVQRTTWSSPPSSIHHRAKLWDL